MSIVRTPDEIVARIKEVESEDWLGTERGDLMEWLPFEHAKSFLKAEVTEAEWGEVIADDGDPHSRAVAYLGFAIEKIVDHRGISAGRSISHLRAWVWLLFPDEEFAKFESAGYAQYGAPKVKVAAEMLGAESVWTAAVEADPELERMAVGDLCEPGCQAGCGS